MRGFDALSESGIIEEQPGNESGEKDNEGKEGVDGGEKNQQGTKGAEGNEGNEGNEGGGTAAAEEEKFDNEGNLLDKEGKIAKTKAQLEEEAGNLTEFKIPGVEGDQSGSEGESPERKAALEALAKDQSWINLGKVRGLDVKENTFESFESALDSKSAADIAAAKLTAKEDAKKEILAEKPAEAMAIIEGLEQGLTIDEILRPTAVIEQLEALSDAELVAEDCRLKNWTDDQIEKHIADLTEREVLEVTAKPLRDILKANREGLAQKQLERFTSLKQSKEAAIVEARTRESEEIKSTLITMKDFMGVPITQRTVDHLIQKWNKGEYHEAFKDSKVISEFLMYKEFGEQGLKALKNREYQRGRDDKAKKLHNIPPIQQNGNAGKVQAAKTVKPEGNFGALPND